MTARRTQRASGAAEMEIRAAQRGRAPSYTVVKDWVPASVSAMAGKLYHFYRMHLNRERDDGLVWPTMETAAVYLGLSRGDKVTPYMDELEGIEAIHATRQGQEDGRYLILVYEDPPDDFAGPVTLKEWYQANRTEIDRRRDAAKVTRAARKAAKAIRSADAPQPGDPPDTPSTGYPDTPSTGDADTPSTGREPLRTEPLRTEPSTASSSYSPSPTTPARPEMEEAEANGSSTDLRSTAARILEDVQITGHAPHGARLRGPRRDQLVAALTERLAAGWAAADAEDALGGPLDNVRSVYAILQTRISGMPTDSPPPPRASTIRPSGHLTRCSKCAPYRPGWIDADPDRAARCSACIGSPKPGFVPESGLVTV